MHDRLVSRRIDALHQCFLVSFGIIGHKHSVHVYARGHKQCCKLHYCLCRVSIKPRLPFSICNVFFISKSNLLDFYFTSLQLVLVSCGGRKTSPRTSP